MIFDKIENTGEFNLRPLKEYLQSFPYSVKETLEINDFEEKKQWLIDESVKVAYQDLPAGEIIEENSETHIVNNTMFAVTTITIYGTIT